MIRRAIDEHRDASAVCCHPEACQVVGGHIVDIDMTETFVRTVVLKAVTIKSTQPLVRCDPQITFCILKNSLDAVMRQPVADRICSDRKTLCKRRDRKGHK